MPSICSSRTAPRPFSRYRRPQRIPAAGWGAPRQRRHRYTKICTQHRCSEGQRPLIDKNPPPWFHRKSSSERLLDPGAPHHRPLRVGMGFVMVLTARRGAKTGNHLPAAAAASAWCSMGIYQAANSLASLPPMPYSRGLSARLLGRVAADRL